MPNSNAKRNGAQPVRSINPQKFMLVDICDEEDMACIKSIRSNNEKKGYDHGVALIGPQKGILTQV